MLYLLDHTGNTDFVLPFPDATTSGESKSRVTDSSQSPTYRLRTEQEQVVLYSPEQTSLHESEGLLLMPPLVPLWCCSISLSLSLFLALLLIPSLFFLLSFSLFLLLSLSFCLPPSLSL